MYMVHFENMLVSVSSVCALLELHILLCSGQAQLPKSAGERLVEAMYMRMGLLCAGSIRAHSGARRLTMSLLFAADTCARARQLADAIGDKALGAALVETTYKYVRILLRSERIKTQSGERSLLKNLGSWLGKLTIARNRPVRHRDLDLKGILYEAYAQGKMIAVLPFVNKARAPRAAACGRLTGAVRAGMLWWWAQGGIQCGAYAQMW